MELSCCVVTIVRRGGALIATVRPYGTTPEQRTTIKIGTIRYTICLSREQALDTTAESIN
ncbi:hypothetical protein OIDMADRAFT_17140 [Oidiodendron maius Zn]|uniref:Uncharacterized protein n=1 Tax=Oidiodendron maius (strain Zn) TaxID=913774 RepID=A0A0C3DVB7_OIDMZ|nr:hypothetical protein OIDMADRAFT_17140 [Oidiodendron maius Zn]